MLKLAPTRSRLPCRASSARACMSSKAVACGMKASARVVAGSRYDCAAPALRRPALQASASAATPSAGPAPTPSPRSENCPCLNVATGLFSQTGFNMRQARPWADGSPSVDWALAPANTRMMFCAAQRSISGAPRALPTYVRSEQRIRMREQRRIDQPQAGPREPSLPFRIHPPHTRRAGLAPAPRARRLHPLPNHDRGLQTSARPFYEGKRLGVDQMLGIGIQGSASRMKSELAKKVRCTPHGRPSRCSVCVSRAFASWYCRVAPHPASAQPWPVRWRPCQGCRP